MARPAGLKRPTALRLGLLAGAVLLAHGVALQWVSRLQAQATLLKPMAAPMYTRVLEQQAPAAPAPATASIAQPAPSRPTARIQPARPARQAAAPAKAASEPTREPEAPVVASAPEPEPPPVAAAEPEAQGATPPVAAASAPQPSASVAVSAPVAAASAPAAQAATWPPDTRLRYKLGGRFRSGELHGDARVLWQRQEQRYQVRVEVSIGFLASLVMTSQGEVGAVLQPQAYEEVRNGKPRGLRVGEQEVLLANGNVVRKPEAGVQDTASQFVELAHRFATGREKLEVGRTVSFHMARPGAVDLWTYDIVAQEVLSTRLGAVQAFHLVPRPIANPRGNITAEMWFAPSLQYLPVRIRVNMGSEAEIDLLVDGIDQQ